MSKSAQDALRELDILALNQHINADATGTWQQSNLEMPESTDWDELTKPRGIPPFFGPMTKSIGDLAGNIDEILPTTPADKYIPNIKTIANLVPGIGDLDTGEYSLLDAVGLGADIVGAGIGAKAYKARKGLTNPRISNEDWILSDLTPTKEYKEVMESIPDNPISFKGSFQKELTLKELTSDPAFHRFMLTNHGEDYAKAFSSEELLDMKKSYQQVMETTLKDPQDSAFKSTYNPRDPYALGTYHPGTRSIELNAHKFDQLQKQVDYNIFDPKLEPKEMYHSTAMHEFDHKAKLYDDAMTMRDLGEESVTSNYDILKPFQKEGRVGRLGMLKWEKKYAQALMDGDYFTPTALRAKHKAISGKKLDQYDKHYNYLMDAREISARIAELREEIRMFGGVRRDHPTLNELKKILNRDGIEFALDNLWGAAPIVPMLNLEEELAE